MWCKAAPLVQRGAVVQTPVQSVPAAPQCRAKRGVLLVSRPSCNAVPSCKVPVQHPNTKPAVQSAHTTPPPPPQSTPPSCNSPPRHTGALMVTTVQFPATPHGGADHLYRATPPSCNSPPLHTGALSLPSNPTIMQYPAPPLGGADGHYHTNPPPCSTPTRTHGDADGRYRAISRYATRGR